MHEQFQRGKSAGVFRRLSTSQTNLQKRPNEIQALCIQQNEELVNINSAQTC